MPHIRRRQCWRTALPTGSPPPPTSGFPPKDATTRPLNLLVHCLPSPAFPPWAGDVAGPLSSEGALARHLGLISNAAALCERQVDAVFRLSLDVAAIEREREREEVRREKLPRLRGSRRRATPRRARAYPPRPSCWAQ